MRRAIRGLAAAFLTAGLWLGLALPAQAQSAPGGCQFVLGFQALHDLDPNDIGDCTDNQAFASNGDAQQHTTKGLMAWRKADNWTAFTNGYMTWINGPNGLASRLNTDRFPWEGAQTQPASSGLPSLANYAGRWVCATVVAKINADGTGSAILFKQPWLSLATANTAKAAVASSYTASSATFKLSGTPAYANGGFVLNAPVTGSQGAPWLGSSPSLSLSPDGSKLTISGPTTPMVLSGLDPAGGDDAINALAATPAFASCQGS